MFSELQARKYRSLDEWFKTPQGERVAQAFAHELQSSSQVIKGERLLQIGSCGGNVWLPLYQARHKWLATPYIGYHQGQVITSVRALPFEKSSIDCIIAPLTLEAFSVHQSPIDELDRVLKPMGYIIFLGINPWSFWGLALKSNYLRCFGHDSATLMSSFSVKLAMTQRGYKQCSHNSFYYIPPVRHGNLIKKMEFLNEVGKMVWPFPAGFYCLIMQKYQAGRPLVINKVQSPVVKQKPRIIAPVSGYIDRS